MDVLPLNLSVIFFIDLTICPFRYLLSTSLSVVCLCFYIYHKSASLPVFKPCVSWITYINFFVSTILMYIHYLIFIFACLSVCVCYPDSLNAFTPQSPPLPSIILVNLPLSPLSSLFHFPLIIQFSHSLFSCTFLLSVPLNPSLFFSLLLLFYFFFLRSLPVTSPLFLPFSYLVIFFVIFFFLLIPSSPVRSPSSFIYTLFFLSHPSPSFFFFLDFLNFLHFCFIFSFCFSV